MIVAYLSRCILHCFKKWKAEIDSLKLSESMEKVLIELLENATLSHVYSILNRFV